MACEDYPCCGHVGDEGPCPDFVDGKQVNMKCTCGATVPIGSSSSICQRCLRQGAPEDDMEDDYADEEDEYDDEEYDDEDEEEDYDPSDYPPR